MNSVCKGPLEPPKDPGLLGFRYKESLPSRQKYSFIYRLSFKIIVQILLICRLKACRNIKTYPFDFYYIPLLNTWT